MNPYSDIQKKCNKDHIIIEEDKSLASFTTMRIGGKAKYLVHAFTKDQLHSIVSISKEHDIPYILIGKGSNLLISDDGFSGIHKQSKE